MLILGRWWFCNASCIGASIHNVAHLLFCVFVGRPFFAPEHKTLFLHICSYPNFTRLWVLCHHRGGWKVRLSRPRPPRDGKFIPKIRLSRPRPPGDGDFVDVSSCSKLIFLTSANYIRALRIFYIVGWAASLGSISPPKQPAHVAYGVSPAPRRGSERRGKPRTINAGSRAARPKKRYCRRMGGGRNQKP